MGRIEVVKFSESYGFADFVWGLPNEHCEPEEFDSLLDPGDTEVKLHLAPSLPSTHIGKASHDKSPLADTARIRPRKPSFIVT